MRIKIELENRNSKNNILPTGFNKYIQAFIYKSLPNEKSEWLHNQGYKYEKRSFKLFCFSSIIERGRFDRNKKEFIFPPKISFYLSSPAYWILEKFAEDMLRENDVFLGQNQLRPVSVGVMKQRPAANNKSFVKTVSPIETHSTFATANGKKKTYYYSPFEKEYSELINRNLQKKWEAFYNKPCEYSMKIDPAFHSGAENRKREKIIFFGTGERRTVIKGWTGRFELNGEKEFINFAQDAGLGSRNSQGFGMVEIV